VRELAHVAYDYSSGFTIIPAASRLKSFCHEAIATIPLVDMPEIFGNDWSENPDYNQMNNWLCKQPNRFSWPITLSTIPAGAEPIQHHHWEQAWHSGILQLKGSMFRLGRKPRNKDERCSWYEHALGTDMLSTKPNEPGVTDDSFKRLYTPLRGSPHFRDLKSNPVNY